MFAMGVTALLSGVPCVAQEVTPDLPMPQPGGPHNFSRAPLSSHYDSITRSFIREYVTPPLCKDGVHTFHTKQYSISPDGKTLTITTYRQQSPTTEHRLSIRKEVYTTDTPYEFRVSASLLRFTMEGEQITGMETLDENGKPAPQKN